MYSLDYTQFDLSEKSITINQSMNKMYHSLHGKNTAILHRSSYIAALKCTYTSRWRGNTLMPLLYKKTTGDISSK